MEHSRLGRAQRLYHASALSFMTDPKRKNWRNECGKTSLIRRKCASSNSTRTSLSAVGRITGSIIGLYTNIEHLQAGSVACSQRRVVLVALRVRASTHGLPCGVSPLPWLSAPFLALSTILPSPVVFTSYSRLPTVIATGN